MSNDAHPGVFLRVILATAKSIAVVGASEKVIRPSHGVFAYLLARFHGPGVGIPVASHAGS